MKKMITLTCLILATISGLSVAFAHQQPVVIPLNSTAKQNNPVIGSYGISGGIFTGSSNYFMSSQTITLPEDGKCAVTVTADVYHVDSGDDARGPYIKVARQVGSGSPEAPGFGGSRMLYVGIIDSTGASDTTAITITANTSYKFGCLFTSVPANWQDDSANCQVSWVCAVE